MKVLYTWEMLEEDIQELKKFIKSNNIDHILTLYRGGLPISVRLSNECNLPLSIVDYQSYDGNTDCVSLIKDAGLKDADNILLFDDIADSGNSINVTIDFLKMNNFNNIHVMTVYGNNKFPHWSYLREHSGEWVTFAPWEGNMQLDKTYQSNKPNNSNKSNTKEKNNGKMDN